MAEILDFVFLDVGAGVAKAFGYALCADGAVYFSFSGGIGAL